MLKNITRIVFLAVLLLSIRSNSYETNEEDNQLHIDRSSVLEKNILHSEIEEFLDSIQSISTISPTWEPTEFPTLEPTNVRTESPTIVSSIVSTEFPTFPPTVNFPPSSIPTVSHQPTTSPTWESTAIPSIASTQSPTTLIPSTAPSLSSQPTVHPTYMPTFTPTVAATSQEPTMAPSFQNRPIIRVECNITLYNISTSSLNGDEMTAINRATALMLKVPFDRVSTARWKLVGVQTTRRRKLSTSESGDTDKTLLTAPESLWDVTAEKEDSFSRDGKSFASDDNFDSEFTSSQKNSQKTSSYGESPNLQQHRNIQTEIGVFYDSSEDLASPAYASLNSNFSSPNSHDDVEEPQVSRPLLRDNTQNSKHYATSQQQSIFSWLFARICFPSLVKYFSSQQIQSSFISHVTTLDVTLTSDTNYEFFYTAQVEVMMVDFPEYRSITNGTRLMNFLRQRVRSNLRTGNFSHNIQRQWQHLGYTSSTSAMAKASASRVVLRNQGLVFAPSFAPTPSPIAVKENAAVATSIAGMVVGIAGGCLAIGAILVICAGRRAEHQLPPKPVELTSLLSIEEGKEERDTTARGGKGKTRAAKARKPSGSKIAGMEEDDENAMLPSALKNKPQNK